MNKQEERDANTRTELCSMLDSACSHIGQVSRAVKRLDHLKIVLYMKRDKAKTAIQECMKKLQEQLQELHKLTECQLNQEVISREELLRSTKVKLMKHIKDTASECTAIEELLEAGNETSLADKGTKILHTMVSLLKFNPDKAVVGLTHLEFHPNGSNIRAAFHDPSLIGFLQCTAVNPSEITVKIGEEETFPKRVFVGEPQTVTIHTGSDQVENLKHYMDVRLLQPNMNIKELAIMDKEDGTYTAEVVPQVSGSHALDVKVYGTPISGSPLPLFVWDQPPPSESLPVKESTSPLKVRLCRDTLTAVSKHIESNPPVKAQLFARSNSSEVESSETFGTTSKNNSYKAMNQSSKPGVKRRSFLDEVSADMALPVVEADGKKIIDEHSSSTNKTDFNLTTTPRQRKTSLSYCVNERQNTDFLEYGQGDTGQQGMKRDGRRDSDTPKHNRSDSTNNWRNPQNKWNPETKSRHESEPYANKGKSFGYSQPSVIIRPEKRHSGDSSKANESCWEDELVSVDCLADQEKTTPQTSSEQSISGVLGRKLGHPSESNSPCPSVPQNTPNTDPKEAIEKFSSDAETVVQKASQTLLSAGERLGETPGSTQGVEMSPSYVTESSRVRESNWQTPGIPGGSFLSEKEFVQSASKKMSQGCGTDEPETPSTNNQNCKDYMPPVPTEKPIVKKLPLRSPIPNTVAQVVLHSGQSEEVWELDNNNNTGPISSNSSSKKTKNKLGEAMVSEDSPPIPSYPKQVEKISSERNSTCPNMIENHMKEDKVLKFNIVTKFGRRGNGNDFFSFPIGATVNSCQEIIVCDSGNHMVKVYDWKGNHQFSIGQDSKTFARPSAVVTNSNNDIFVKDDKQIQAFDKSGQFLRAFGRGSLVQPFGLTLTDEGQILTLDQNRHRPKILFYSQMGEMVRECSLQPIATDRSARCRFLTIHKDRLYTVDLGKSQIYITDLNGKTIKTFGSSGGRPGQFREPSGITVDPHGNLLIADSKNNRVQLFTSEGEFRCIVRLNQDITRPSDIHYTDDGHLVIVNFLMHCIKVYSITSST